MMKWVFSGLIFISFIFGILTDKMNDLSLAAINSSSKAVELSISLLGSMCLWMGIMKVAEDSGLTEKISKILFPVTRFLFKRLDKNSKALRFISMNITANLLGLGNAATPLGISAMKEIREEEKVADGEASSNMIMLVVLNTASIQILPTTIAMLRVKHGSNSPLDILPAILISSCVALVIGIMMVKICASLYNKSNFKNSKKRG